MGGESWVLVGTVVGVHGIAGEVKVSACSGAPDRFSGISRVFVKCEADRAGRLRCDYASMAIERERAHGGLALIKLEGIDDRSAAEAIVGADIYLHESELPALPDDHYYNYQLVGLICESTSGERLGVVVDVLEMPANDVIVVEPDEGREFLVPAVKDIVRQVDIAGGRLVIDDRPGLR